MVLNEKAARQPNTEESCCGKHEKCDKSHSCSNSDKGSVSDREFIIHVVDRVDEALDRFNRRIVALEDFAESVSISGDEGGELYDPDESHAENFEQELEPMFVSGVRHCNKLWKKYHKIISIAVFAATGGNYEGDTDHIADEVMNAMFGQQISCSKGGCE